MLKNARMRRRASRAEGSWYPAPGMSLPRTAKRRGASVSGGLVVVEEFVPGLRIFLHVMLDPRGRQRLLQAGCRFRSDRSLPP